MQMPAEIAVKVIPAGSFFAYAKVFSQWKDAPKNSTILGEKSCRTWYW